jgi:hypothetical protein
MTVAAENPRAPGVSLGKPESAPILSARRSLIGTVALPPVLAACAVSLASSMGHRLQSMSGAGKTEAFREVDKKCNDYGRAAETVAYDAQPGF